MPKVKSANPKIDKAIKDLMKGVADYPPETAVKVVAVAINWEKVKYAIKDDDAGGGFRDPSVGAAETSLDGIIG